MSWYFLGGFSAWAIVPSARVVNHSGWLLTHGWSGAHCSARSRATSRLSPHASATKESKSAKVPSAGDGTIAYAENPPKKYQDIYPVNFDNDPAGIYAEVR